jgi:hypothetical protein
MPQGHIARDRLAAWGLLGAAAAWPSLFGLLANFARTPLERALLSSWCGVAPHADPALFGHCAVCWEGSALLALAGVLLLRMTSQPAPAVRRR